MEQKIELSKVLLVWYDENARILPWRISPKNRKLGLFPDPYFIWLSEVMLQQTTVVVVKEYFLKFTKLWPTVQKLAEANDADVMAAWAGLGYYARARNLLKTARIISFKLNGIVPNLEVELQKLPGIGSYTSAAISAIAFDLPMTVMDGNVERVMARMHAIKQPLPKSKDTLYKLANMYTPDMRPGDYAQAVMDLGATICRPKKPLCDLCPWEKSCIGFALGCTETLPIRIKKKKKLTRFGSVYVALRCDGAVVLERRPNKGLLGGMLGWPGGDWGLEKPHDEPPFSANWKMLPKRVLHTFTHFHLELTVFIVLFDHKEDILLKKIIDKDHFIPKSMPVVMQKVWDLAWAEFENL